MSHAMYLAILVWHAITLYQIMEIKKKLDNQTFTRDQVISILNKCTGTVEELGEE